MTAVSTTALARTALHLTLLAAWACGSKEATPDTGCKNGICAQGASDAGGNGAGGGTGGAGGKGGSGGSGGASPGTGGGTTGGSGNLGGDAGDSSTGGSAAGGSSGASSGSSPGGSTNGGSANGGGSGGTNGGSSNGGSGGTSAGGSNSGNGGSGGTGPCVESWSCTPWQTNGTSDDATRVCSDTNQCGTNDQKPSETALLPPLDLNFYKCNVEPVLDHKCSMMGCHGKEQGRALRIYARGRLRITGDILVESSNGCGKQGQMYMSERCTGSLECRCSGEPHTANEWRRNFDSARGFALDANGDRLAAGAESDSDLVAQPVVGGKAHAGIHLFRDTDADYDTLIQWLSGAKQASCTTNN